jgi:hypothetical protein
MLKCDYCDYTSKRKHNLNRHIELTHLNINTTTDNRIIEYVCNTCNKKFASDYSLKRHMNLCKNAIQSEENVHQCEENVHHCEENVHQCEENVHQCEENVHRFEEKVIQSKIIFNCSKCGKQYKTKKYLIEHEEKCIGLNILSCPKCMKTFSSRSSKSNHIKKNNCKPRSIINAITNNITNNNINNNCNNTINNNYIINNYGNERIDYITFQNMIEIFKNSGDYIIPKYIKLKHYNKEFPENHNIKYTNDGCLVKINNEWIYKDINDFSETLLNRNATELKKYFDNKKRDIDIAIKEVELFEFINSRLNYLDLQLNKFLFNSLKKEIKNIVKSNIYI